MKIKRKRITFNETPNFLPVLDLAGNAKSATTFRNFADAISV